MKKVELKGSEKQIKWAEDLKAEIEKALNAVVDHYAAKLEKAEAKGKEKSIEKCKTDLKNAKIEVAFAEEIISSIENASTIIDEYKGFKFDEYQKNWFFAEGIIKKAYRLNGEFEQISVDYMNAETRSEAIEVLKAYFAENEEVAEEESAEAEESTEKAFCEMTWEEIEENLEDVSYLSDAEIIHLIDEMPDWSYLENFEGCRMDGTPCNKLFDELSERSGMGLAEEYGYGDPHNFDLDGFVYGACDRMRG